MILFSYPFVLGQFSWLGSVQMYSSNNSNLEMKRPFWTPLFSSNVGRPLSYFQVIISKQRVLLFKFYFKDQRCEDVSMNSMMDHPSSQESAIVVTILMIIVITVYDNHHHFWWWWSPSCRRWSPSLLWMTMIIIMPITMMITITTLNDDDGDVRKIGAEGGKMRQALTAGSN